MPTARAFVTRTLVPLALSVEATDRLVLACAEAFNNVVLHASGDSFAVTVAVESGACTVRVADDGDGFTVPAARPVMPPASEVNHRGLALMYALVDRVDVVSTARGTAVVLAQALGQGQGAGAAAGDRAPRRSLSVVVGAVERGPWGDAAAADAGAGQAGVADGSQSDRSSS